MPWLRQPESTITIYLPKKMRCNWNFIYRGYERRIEMPTVIVGGGSAIGTKSAMTMAGREAEIKLRKDILEAYAFLRANNHSIPDESLEYIKYAALDYSYVLWRIEQCERESDSLAKMVDDLDAEKGKLVAENAAIRALMDSYNLGGWTDALAPMERALKAESEKAALEQDISDYEWIVEQVAKVYDHITGGKLSKPNYEAGVVIRASDDRQTEEFEEWLKEEMQDGDEERDALLAKLKIIEDFYDNIVNDFSLKMCHDNLSEDSPLYEYWQIMKKVAGREEMQQNKCVLVDGNYGCSALCWRDCQFAKHSDHCMHWIAGACFHAVARDVAEKTSIEEGVPYE
jgi:hypothetical protein